MPYFEFAAALWHDMNSSLVLCLSEQVSFLFANNDATIMKSIAANKILAIIAFTIDLHRAIP